MVVRECKEDLLGNISHGIDDRLVTDPDMARWYPSSNFLVSSCLLKAPRLRDNMSNRMALSIAGEMVRHGIGVLIHDPPPSIRMSPPFEDIQDYTLLSNTLTPRNLYTSVVAELELDSVGSFLHRLDLTIDAEAGGEW